VFNKFLILQCESGANGPGEELDHGSRVYPGAVGVSVSNSVDGLRFAPKHSSSAAPMGSTRSVEPIKLFYGLVDHSLLE
jgi:hypothetical protein